MTASDAESWARLRLVEGESSATKWELVSSLGHTTLTVGSNSDCTWVVRAAGVRPIHFSLHWDGGTLRAADVYSAGDVRVDGVTLTTQWRPLLGRSRIEFGRAAMVVEASANTSAQPRSGEHPLEGPIVSEQKRKNPAPRSGKETLIGVASSMIAGLVTPSVRPESSQPPPSHSSPAGPPSSVPPGNTPPGKGNDRSMKATLVGGIGIGSQPTPLSQPAASPGGPKPNATLMGFSVVDSMRGMVGTAVPGGSIGEPDQRTTQGYPGRDRPASSGPPPSTAPAGRRMTQKGVISQPPGVSPDAVAQAPMRNVASDAPGAPQQRIQSAWQERPEEGMGGRTLRGMSQPPDAADPDFVPGAPRIPRTNNVGTHTAGSWGDLGDRLSDVPTQMRDPASFESRRPRKGFPWRYVGVLVLTGVAYFAWLYLLDHM